MMKQQPICKHFASDQTKTLQNPTVAVEILNLDKPPVEAKSGCAAQNVQHCLGARTALIKRQETMLELKRCPDPGTFGGEDSLARHLFESEFEVIPSDGAVEVIFIPTSSRYTFSRLSNRSDDFEFGLLSPDPRIRHTGSSNCTPPEVRYMAFRLASEAARRGWS